MGEGTGGGKEERHRMKRRERRRGKERDGTGETKSDQMGSEFIKRHQHAPGPRGTLSWLSCITLVELLQMLYV